MALPARVEPAPPTPVPSSLPHRPEESEMTCLSWYDEGCHMINDKETCLGSRDGRGNNGRHGLRLHGEPCVWCDGPCHSEDDTHCEPYDFMMNGESKSLFFLK